jgi:uncharacterized damage-inducible protein DinB
MPITAADLRAHMRYSTWASRRLVDAAVKLTDEERARDFQTADKSVVGSLAHIFAADRAWLGRVRGASPTKFIDDRDRHLDVLLNAWPPLLEQWDALLAAETDATVARNIIYRNLKGDPNQTPLWHIVLHVVNHGTHHRGQVSGFLRALGHTPPPIDLIIYYREQAQA